MTEKKNIQKTPNRWIPFAIVFVVLVFLFIIFDPLHWIVKQPQTLIIYHTDQAGGVTPIIPTLTPLPTNYPSLIREYFENENQPDALIIGATVIVIITLIITLMLLRREQKSGNEKPQ
jgi:preprotein translocase subunit YajC